MSTRGLEDPAIRHGNLIDPGPQSTDDIIDEPCRRAVCAQLASRDAVDHRTFVDTLGLRAYAAAMAKPSYSFRGSDEPHSRLALFSTSTGWGDLLL